MGSGMSIRLLVLFMAMVIAGCQVITVSKLPVNKYNLHSDYQSDRWAFKRLYVDNQSTEQVLLNSLEALKCKYNNHQFYHSIDGLYIVSNTKKVASNITSYGHIYLLLQLEVEPSINETAINIRWLVIRKLPKEKDDYYVEMTDEQQYFNLDLSYLKESANSYGSCDV